jgi:hypothetical protein
MKLDTMILNLIKKIEQFSKGTRHESTVLQYVEFEMLGDSSDELSSYVITYRTNEMEKGKYITISICTNEK